MSAVPFFFAGIREDLSTNFAIQRQSNHGFSAVACDQTIEQTANRVSKTKGGLIGFSMNRATVHRWLLSQSERATITSKWLALNVHRGMRFCIVHYYTVYYSILPRIAVSIVPFKIVPFNDVLLIFCKLIYVQV